MCRHEGRRHCGQRLPERLHLGSLSQVLEVDRVAHGLRRSEEESLGAGTVRTPHLVGIARSLVAPGEGLPRADRVGRLAAARVRDRPVGLLDVEVEDRKIVVWVKSVSVRVDTGGGGNEKKKK